MVWEVTYHPEVQDDLESIGRPAARRILKVIEERLVNGSPERSGKRLRGNLAGCRRIHSGSYRIIYKVNGDCVEVLILAVSSRRDNEVYVSTSKRG